MSTKPFVIPKQPDQIEAKKNLDLITKRSSSLVVKDRATFDTALQHVQKLDSYIAWVGEKFDGFVGGLHELHKQAVALRATFLSPAETEKKRLLKSRMDWRTAEEQKQKLIDDANAKKLAAQQQKDLEKTAKKLEKQGETEAAAEVREIAKTAPPPTPPPTPAVEKQEGTAVRGTWKVELIPEEAHLVPRDFCVPNDALARAHVKIYKDTKPIPGYRIWFERNEYTRSA